MNLDLPFGGVGFSGYGRYHGHEGFKAFSNMKCVLIKPVIKMYPYSQVYPPFTPERIKFIKFLFKVTNMTQRQAVKRLLGLLIAIFVVINIARGKINRQTFLNIKLGLVTGFHIASGHHAKHVLGSH
jgi:hypothetical protein